MIERHAAPAAKPVSSNIKKILLVVHINTFFTELGQLATLLARDKSLTPEVMFYPYGFAKRDARSLVTEGVNCVDANGCPFPANDRDSIAGKILDSIAIFLTRTRSLLRRVSLFDLADNLVSLAWRRRSVQRILHARSIDLVVLGGDMVGYDTAAFIDACHRVNVQVIIVPSTMSNGLEQAEVYSADPRHGFGSWINRFVARRYPKWLHVHKGQPVLREHGARTLALEWLGLAPPLPWIFNSGRADIVTVESDAMKDYYVRAGLRQDNLVVTGSPSDDKISVALKDSDVLKRDLCRSLALPEDKPILLVSPPPDTLYMVGGRPQCDFKTYVDLVTFWMKCIDIVSGFTKIVCLHPSVDPDTMRYIETPELKIASIRTAELIPLCDLYVASVSSTIRWAIACGKPVINYDVYRYRYTDYLGLKGVLTIEEQNEFLALLQRMATDSVYRNEITELQKIDAPQWGNLDGKAGQRIMALFNGLAKDKRL